jgi:hypothetical protein
MGLLDDFGIDTNDIELPSFEVEDGIYEFEIGDMFVKNGSQNYPDRSWVIIEYILGDTGQKKSEMFELPVDASNMTDKERQKIGFYVQRLMDLGVSRDAVNSVDRDDIIGLQGTLQVYSQTGKGKNAGKQFQNIKSVKVAKASNESAPAVEKKAAPATRATSAANPFAK